MPTMAENLAALMPAPSKATSISCRLPSGVRTRPRLSCLRISPADNNDAVDVIAPRLRHLHYLRQVVLGATLTVKPHNKQAGRFISASTSLSTTASSAPIDDRNRVLERGRIEHKIPVGFEHLLKRYLGWCLRPWASRDIGAQPFVLATWNARRSRVSRVRRRRRFRPRARG